MHQYKQLILFFIAFQNILGMHHALGQEQKQDLTTFNRLTLEMKNIIEREPNPYLAGDMENSLLDICEDKISQLPEEFPAQFKEKTGQLLKELDGLQRPQRQDRRRTLRQRVEQICAQQINLWDAATNLLKLSCVKSLPHGTRNSIMELLKDDQISSQNFLKYMLDSPLNKQRLREELKFRDHQIFFSQVIKCRPPVKIPNNRVAQCLQRYIKRISSIEGWLFAINRPNSFSQLRQGLIVKAQFKNGTVVLLLQELDKQSKVALSMEDKYINEVKFGINDPNNQPLVNRFENLQQSEKQLVLSKITKIEKAQRLIQSRRQLLKDKLSSGQYKDQYQFLLSLLIDKKLHNQSYSGLNIQKEVIQLVKLYRVIGTFTDLSTELIALLKQVNFNKFISADRQYFSQEAIKMLRQANKEAASLQGKKIIAFYGKTGSGKSTYVNYFMGLKLEKRSSIAKTAIYEVSQADKYYENQAQISHSFATSHTLYSKGFGFMEQRYEALDLKDYLLCDNPGFGDSRQQDHLIVTNYSMDKAVKACDQVKAIVLVLQLAKLTSERSTGLIENISNLKKLFPLLLDPNSESFQHFFIIFTKLQCKLNRYDLLNLIKQNEDQLRTNLENNKKKQIAQSKTKQSIRVCEALKELINQERIFLNEISEDINDRQHLLTKMINQAGYVSKKQFNCPINNQNLDQLIQKVMNYCSSWKQLVFTPFIKTIPQQIKQANKDLKLQQNNRQVVERKLNIFTSFKQTKRNLLQQIQDQRIPMLHKDLQLAGCEQNMIQQLRQPNVNSSQQRSYAELLQKRQKQLNDQIKQIRQLRGPLNQDKDKILQEIQLIDKDLPTCRRKNQIMAAIIQKMKKSSITIGDYTKKFKIRQKYQLGTNQYLRQKQWGSYFKSYFVPRKQITVGEKEEQLVVNLTISFNHAFNIDYQPAFDPQKFLKKHKPNQQVRTLQIKSHKAILKDFKLDEDRCKINLCVYFRIPANPISEQDLPYLIIEKKLPGKQFYHEQIQLLTIILKVDTICIQIMDKRRKQLQQKIQSVQSQLNKIQKKEPDIDLKLQAISHLKQLQVKQKQMLKQGSLRKLLELKKDNIIQLNSIVEDLKGQILDAQQSLEQAVQYLSRSKAKFDQIYIKRISEEDRYTKLGFLIDDQQKNGSLQILENIARIVIELVQDNIEKDTDLQSETAQVANILKQFLKAYEDYKTAIKKPLTVLLQ